MRSERGEAKRGDGGDRTPHVHIIFRHHLTRESFFFWSLAPVDYRVAVSAIVVVAFGFVLFRPVYPLSAVGTSRLIHCACGS